MTNQGYMPVMHDMLKQEGIAHVDSDKIGHETS